MRKNNVLFGFAMILGIFALSGCGGANPSPEDSKVDIVLCPPGSKYSIQYEKCTVLNQPLKAVIKAKKCEDNKCTAIIIDERGRDLELTVSENINVGDTIDLVVFKNPISDKSSSNLK